MIASKAERSHYQPSRRIATIRRLRTQAGIFAAFLAVPALMSVAGAPATAAAAASPAPLCSFADAGTGTYARTLCWLDLSAYDAREATSDAGQKLTFPLPGGYTLSFTLKATGGPAIPSALPTYPDAYLGNNGHYSGITGKPALYQTMNGTTTTASLTDIVVTGPGGHVLSGYALVGADAESTDARESITWTASDPIGSLTQTSTGNGLGNACAGGFTGIGTPVVTCRGSGAGVKTGTAIVDAENPSSFSQTMVGAGLQGVAFGILVSTVQLTKDVVNGFPGDSFRVAISSAGGSVLASADTDGGTSASTGEVTLLTSPHGVLYRFSEAPTSGLPSNYDRSWSCTRNGAHDPSLPGGDAGPSREVRVGIGDFITCVITNTAKAATLSLVKHAGTPVDVNHDGLTDAGDTIRYTFTVTNTGVLPLSAIAIRDDKAGAVDCPDLMLAPGQSAVCRAARPYTITAADVAAGEVVNTATAEGVPPGGTVPIGSEPSTTRTPTEKPAPALSLVKSASPPEASEFVAGEKVTYSFVVTNTGNVPLKRIMVTEQSFSGTGRISAVKCPEAGLAVGQQQTCTATYQITPADAFAGTVTNEATASGIPAGQTVPVSSGPSSATIPAKADASITLTKTASPTTVNRAGQLITYSFKVKNTGNLDLSTVSITDHEFSGTGPPPVARCPRATLVPGQIMLCSASYAVTQADVDSGKPIDNTATARGTPPAGGGGPAVSRPSSAAVMVVQRPAIALDKSADVSTVTAAGEIIKYLFKVKNTGNVTLTGIQVLETSFNASGRVSAISCPASAAAVSPRTQITCTATYAVSRSDLARRALVNTAVATGRLPHGGTSVTSEPSTARVAVHPAPHLPVVSG